MATLEQRTYDGEKARQILENDVFVSVFADIETEITEKWKSSALEADRESLHKYLKTLQLVKTRITQTLETGKLARLELEHKRSLRERLATWQQ